MVGRRRFRFRADAGRGPRISLEWLGFRDAGIDANLDTDVTFELIPPAGAAGVGFLDLTVLRVVGDLSFRNQGAVVASVPVGAMLHVANVGGDQAIDDGINPLSTDLDDFDHRGIMWWRSWTALMAHAPIADVDTIPTVVPFDIKVKRKLSKRDTFIMRVAAGASSISQVSLNCRVLMRQY